MAQNNSQTYKIELTNSKEIYDYCLLNQIVDINGFIQKCFKKGFDIEKYGLLGKSGGDGEKRVEIEVIREKRVEVPVEIIKEVEKIVEIVKEVPVEKIVEKVVTIYDKSDDESLLLKIGQLESELKKFSIKNSELESQVQKFSAITEESTKNNQDEKLKLLQGTLLSLKKQLSLKDEEIKQKEEIIKQLESLKVGPNGAVFLKSSDITKNI
jgi:hypothetical protein